MTEGSGNPGYSAFFAELRKLGYVEGRNLAVERHSGDRRAEALGERWNEFDLEHAIWAVPGFRMKGNREHRVPLSPRVLDIARAMHAGRINDFVFPGQKPGRPLSAMTLKMVLLRMGITDVTVHGFRAAFRDWAAMHPFYQRGLQSRACPRDRKQGRGRLTAYCAG
jgi:integrase